MPSRRLGFGLAPGTADVAVAVEASDSRDWDRLDGAFLVAEDEMESELVRALILGWMEAALTTVASVSRR